MSSLPKIPTLAINLKGVKVFTLGGPPYKKDRGAPWKF